MRKAMVGLVVVFGIYGVCLGQNPATQQNQQPQAGQNQPGQIRAGQQGQVVQPGQPGQNQFNQQGQAAQPGQPGQPVGPAGQFAQRPQTGQPGQAGSADQEIAALLHGACRNEIEIAKLGQEKAQSQDVKQFAEKMVRDHSPGSEELQKLAGSLASSSQHHQGGETPARQGQGGRLDWLSIHQQIADQCLNTVKQELSKKSSHDFDECFMGQQIGAHIAVIDKLKVLRNYASSDLQQKLDKELKPLKATCSWLNRSNTS